MKQAIYVPPPGQEPTGICECGCGQPTGKNASYTNPETRCWRGYPLPYLPGHRRKCTRSDLNQSHLWARYNPPPDQIPSGICECGCGEKTPIADRTFSKLRWFIGHPKPFIKGHHARSNHLGNRGSKHPAWKGGRWQHKNGYIYLFKPEHPDSNAQGYLLEHRLVAQEMLNRRLNKYEIVHHKNGLRDDNRPDNLEVCILKQRQHPVGQRMSDLISNLLEQPEFKVLNEATYQSVKQAIHRVFS